MIARRSPFLRALDDYGLKRCSMSASGQLWVGLPPHADSEREPVDALPGVLRAVCFVEGPEQAEIVSAFVASPHSRSVEFLMIGSSHDYRPSPLPAPMDFSRAVAALDGASMPALTKLTLGDMERLFNGHVYFGRVGEFSHVFEMAPNLLSLYVCGCSSLARPICHAKLEQLVIHVDDIGVSGGPLSQGTVDNILGSRLPHLKTLELALDEEHAQPYDVPETFFTDNGLPVLERFGVDRLKPEAETRIRAWAAARKLRWTS